MNDEWREIDIDSLGEVITGKTPPTARSDYFGGETPFITPTDMDGRRRISVTERYLSNAGKEAVAKAVIPAGAVLVSCIGSDMGKAAIAGRISVTNQQINSLIVSPPNSELFVYYNLSSRRDEIRGIAAGSAQPILNKSSFSRLRLRLPPPGHQKAIAETLGALDDKIEQNRRTGRALEGLARATFKAWFVDFEPVKAKATGQTSFPGMPPSAFAALPDRLVESLIGPVPRGWNLTSVGEVTKVTSGKRPATKTSTFSDATPIPLWGGNGPMAFVSEALYREPILLTGRVGTLGVVFRINEPCWPSDNTLVVLPAVENMYEVLYFELQRIDFASLNRGSTQPLLTQSDLKAHRFAMANEPSLTAFHNITSKLFALIDAAKQESSKLAVLRDYLLPRLLSGRVRVSNAELPNKEAL